MSDFYLWVSKILISEKLLYITYMFFHWLKIGASLIMINYLWVMWHNNEMQRNRRYFKGLYGKSILNLLFPWLHDLLGRQNITLIRWKWTVFLSLWINHSCLKSAVITCICVESHQYTIDAWFIVVLYDTIMHTAQSNWWNYTHICTHERHFIPRSYGWTMGCLSRVIHRKMTAIYRERTVLDSPETHLVTCRH